jgi:predicted negative regulator of RcsB-dependent stress response
LAETAQAAVPTRHADDDTIHRLIEWARGHRNVVTYGLGGLVVAAALVAWNLVASRRSEDAAGEQLQQARAAFEQRNLPLAASEFARIRENYSGTRAAQEATLLLAQSRLLQGQAQQAIDVLTGFAGSADDPYRAQAHGLLGAAYEEVGKARDAAAAYLRAADASQLPSFKAQFLSDAGRTWVTAGDTAQAVATYQRIVRDLPETGPVAEATVRLGELTKGAVTLPEPKAKKKE